MTGDRELAEIHARQAVRTARAAVAVAGGGGVGTLATAFLLAGRADQRTSLGVFLAVLGIGLALVAVLYAVVSALQTQAQAAAARHLAAALDRESGHAQPTQR